jgi:hypothetical protein
MRKHLVPAAFVVLLLTATSSIGLAAKPGQQPAPLGHAGSQKVVNAKPKGHVPLGRRITKAIGSFWHELGEWGKTKRR